MYSKEEIDKKIGILDWGIVLSLVVLFITVYVPQSIWNEEVSLRNEARFRMNAIAQAEEFYYEMTGTYTLDGKQLFELVEAAMDSLIADSLFVGNKVINLKGVEYPVLLEKGFEYRVDTTFSKAMDVRKFKLDTIYTIGLINEETGGTDTIFVNNKDLKMYESDSESFSGIFSTDTMSRSEIKTDYLRNKYHLNEELLYCPISGEKFKFKIDNSDEKNTIFSVSSPLPLDYSESRYLIFTFESGSHGSITGGNTSWASE